jgi:hypothetical protein
MRYFLQARCRCQSCSSPQGCPPAPRSSAARLVTPDFRMLPPPPLRLLSHLSVSRRHLRPQRLQQQQQHRYMRKMPSRRVQLAPHPPSSPRDVVSGTRSFDYFQLRTCLPRSRLQTHAICQWNRGSFFCSLHHTFKCRKTFQTRQDPASSRSAAKRRGGERQQQNQQQVSEAQDYASPHF